MAYRETTAIRERKRQMRERLLRAARELVARGGYGAARVNAVARRAGVATGTVYRYFPSKAELFAHVFRVASQHELDAFAAAASGNEPASMRLRRAISVFTRRALRGSRLAWALIAEPVDPRVEQERLVFRQAYAACWERLLREGIAAGDFAPQDARISAAAMVGAMSEVLVGPLSRELKQAGTPAAGTSDEQALVEQMIRFCLAAVSGEVSTDEYTIHNAGRLGAADG